MLALTRSASADVTFVAEAPAAVAVSDAQRGVFRPGVMPAAGVYVGRKHVLVGLRMRAGVLRNGPAPSETFVDPGTGGLVTGSLAVRALFGAGWTEIAGGAGITGSDRVPTLELGIGWGTDVGSMTLGPSLRYVRVISNDRMDTLGSADLLMAGIDVRWGGPKRPTPVRARAIVAARPQEPVVPTSAGVPVDEEALVDTNESCSRDLVGCPIIENVEFEHDRMVLDDRVLFDYNRARVRSAGRVTISQLSQLWHAHPEWTHITVEGHADVRGSDEYNLALSQRRAERVREVMIKAGCHPERIEAVGYGRSRPRAEGARSESEHQRNRRVEFAIVREVKP